MRAVPIQLIARVSAWLLAAVIVVLSVVPPNLRPETGTPHNFEHFAIFCATGIAFALGYARRHRLVLVSLVVFAGAIELVQIFIPNRHARLADFIVDAFAVCAGVILCRLLVGGHNTRATLSEGAGRTQPR
jgi:VanZ family protein